MKENKIDGASLKECILAAAAALEANKKQLNDLNVFPVPDGDTGTNMSLTMKSVVKEVQAVTDITVKNISAAAAKGALKGARGNSGVIIAALPRFCRSFGKMRAYRQQYDGRRSAQRSGYGV